MRPLSRNPVEALWTALAGLLGLILAATPVHARSEKLVRCPPTRDVWLSAVDGEMDFNMGRASTLKLKVWQEFALVDFDVSAVRGHTVQRATLYLSPAGGHRLGLNGGSDLRWLTVSTVTHDWVEGESRRYGIDRRGRGATFNESSYRTQDWGWQGSRVWDVILGNGNSLRFDGMLTPTGGGWLKMDIAPELVESLAAGTSYGLALMDGSTAVFVNSLIHSHESGRGPYLEVELGSSDSRPPPAPTEIQVDAHSARATESTGAAWISMRLPPEVLAIDLVLNGAPLDRWQIPHPRGGGGVLSFPILDLEPSSELHLEFAAIDHAGNRSLWTEAQGRSSPMITAPLLSVPDQSSQAEGRPDVEPPRIWALPAVSKLDPVTHLLIDEPTPPDLAYRNAVWNSETEDISLIAARGEIVSFQLVVQDRGRSCEFQLPDLLGPARIPREHAKLWRNWQVGGIPELVLPVTRPMDLPSLDNALPEQQSQSFTLDFHIPGDTPPGTYTGTLGLRCRAATARQLDVQVRVFNALIPDEIRFNIELNTYNGPGTAGSERFVASQRLAHYHRATINRVPYSQKGRLHEDWAPEITGDGHLVSWDRFDRNLGGMLDGTWFVDNPRSGIPAPVLYLPLFEGWPRDYRGDYRPGVIVPPSAAEPMARLRHDILAKPIENSLPESFGQAFRAALRGFANHVAEKGWDRTLFQVYLNNKPRFQYSLWSFDEPFKLLDWRALNYFARLTREALSNDTPATTEGQIDRFNQGGTRSHRSIVFRADVSRPMWQGSVADGLVDVLYLSDQAYEVPRMVQQLKSRMPALLYNYGHTNAIGENNWRSVAWCLDAYLNQFDGILPWQSIHGPRAMSEPIQTALIVDGGNYGPAIASLRVHALREGAQLVELLRLLQLSRNWSRGQLAAVVHQLLPHDSQISRDRPPRTPMASVAELSARDFLQLKLGVLQLLADSPQAQQSH